MSEGNQPSDNLPTEPSDTLYTPIILTYKYIYILISEGSEGYFMFAPIHKKRMYILLYRV
jgi:hypothetical protein